MKKLIALFVLHFLLFNQIVLAQAPTPSKVTVSGYISDASTGERMIGAAVYFKEIEKAVSCNAYGFYSMSVAPGTYTIVFSYVGFVTNEAKYTLTKNQSINIELKPRVIETQEIIVSAQKQERNIQSTEMSKIEVGIDQIKALPALMGEVDVLKAIQLLPGVKSAGEGNSGFYVRGGGPDQNLILLDEAVVYNASHLFGFFSVFNSDAIKNVSLTKGGMPAQYGGRLSSVLDISMKDGNNKEVHGEGGIGYIASRFTLEGPIVKDKASFIVSGRRTFIDLLLREPFVPANSRIAGNSYYFFDLNGKINYTLSNKDRLYLSCYLGKDIFNFRSPQTGFKVKIPWGNATAAFRWNHLFNEKLFVNNSLIFTNYNFEFGAAQQQFDFKIFSGIRDYSLKSDFNWYPTVLHNVKFGMNYIYHRFTPTNVSARSGDVQFDLGEVKRYYAHDLAVYVNDDWEIDDQWKVSGGLRFSMFEHVGPFTRYIQDPLNTNNIIDSISYKTGDKVKMYAKVEPRFNVRYQINNRSSIKASFTQNYQYIHLASFGSVSLPTDVWVPSTDKVKPQFSTQYALGYFKNLKKNTFETSVEVYYKTMENLIEYREGVTPDQDVKNNADNNFVFGKGDSYGAEFFIKKNEGKLTGWIGYTLSYTNRQFAEINYGKEFPAKYDRRHDCSVVLNYQKSKRWTFGAVWVYSTGDALTLPSQKYFASTTPPVSVGANGEINLNNNFNVLSLYQARNSFRQKSYHRLDVSATYHGKKHKNYEGSWVFSIYNVYSRKNPYFIYFNVDGNSVDGNLSVQAKQVSLFGLIPSVTYNFKF
jgi:hypothetical protein